MEYLAITGLAFLVVHFLPATQLRPMAIGAMGERAYMGLYSLVSLVLIVLWVRAFNATAPDAPLWLYPDWWPWLKAVIMLFAALLLIGAFSSPNPSVPQGGKLLDRPDIGAGIMAITRHPGLWAFGLWGIVHLISQPNWRGFWFYGLFAITALFGAVLQEKRKARELGDGWQRFEAKTSFLPFVAILHGRAKFSLSAIGWWRIGLAVVIWAAILHFHGWLFGAPPLPGLA